MRRTGSAIVIPDPAKAVSDGLSTTALTMDSAENVAEATPSALTDGDDFTVTFDNSGATGTTGTTGSGGSGGGGVGGGGGAGGGGGRHHHLHHHDDSGL